MKPVKTTVRRFAPLHGWANRILRIDLGTMSITAQEAAPYVPTYLGARGIGARLAWEEYPEPIDPFAPENPLMIISGALTGSRAPYSGRASLLSFSPQAWPYHFFTRSNIGGHFGGELKRAGYDAVIVTGAAESPVRIVIRDDDVAILPANEFWGQDSLDVIDAIETQEGKGMRTLAIGQAGENLSRMATIQTATSSACGHGGFGAVMGAKKLKAISVAGSGEVTFADTERMQWLIREIGKEGRSQRSAVGRIKGLRERVAEECGGSARVYSCTESCPSPCNVYYENIPGPATGRTYSGHWTCVGSIFRGMSEAGPIGHGGLFDWRLGLQGGMEMNALSNRWGLNQWELITSVVPWLEVCQYYGLIDEFNGHKMDWLSPDFWYRFLHAITFREGLGDAVAEGGWKASLDLRLGEEWARRYYTGWGFPGHWDGHACWHNPLPYPFWLVSALQWLTDTRDPIPSGHGYVHAVALYQNMYKPPAEQAENGITWDHMRAIAERIYGSPAALDPYSDYEAKASPGFYHTKRSVMKDCLPVDDFVFPMIYSPNTPDHYCRIGDIEGPSLEYHLFKAGTGAPWSEGEFEQAAERIYTLERALQVRHWARDRKMDELVLPAYEYLENWQNPMLDKRYALDPVQFKPVMDEYYALRGWGVESGWPTAEHLNDVGLAEVHEPMVAGAQAARERLPEPPKPQPVPVVPFVNLEELIARS